MSVRLTGLDHIGAPTPDAAAAAAMYEQLGMRVIHEETLPAFNIEAICLATAGTVLELLEPTGPGPVADFLERSGPGFQHVAYQVADLRATMATLRAAGVGFRTETPVTGVGGAEVVFLERASSEGLETELVQAPGGFDGQH